MPKIKKQIKCKQVKFSIDEWNKVEQRAAGVKMKTATYIQRMAVDGKIMRLENSECRDVIKAINRIGVSINQIARKANETHNLYAADIEKLKGEHEELCLILSKTHTYKTNINHISPCKKIKVLRNNRNTFLFHYFKSFYYNLLVSNKIVSYKWFLYLFDSLDMILTTSLIVIL